MKKLQVIDHDKLQTNPFSFSLKIEATRVTDTKKYIPDSDGIMYPVEYVVEKEKTTKLYICPAARDMVANLSPGAHRLFFHIIYSLDPGCDYLQINTEFYMRKNSVKSIKTYNEAVKELCRYNFILQSVDYKNIFWINPALFFSGSRIAKYPDNVTIKSTLSK